ncbi:MAG: gliding motility-associated C-terminal domain-containing protein [Sphingobacteriales bacterium]|nr:MAG: gliding motility-associated C-terminal domain-containing protein [Sphingobacteriales bacterium]
MTLTVKPKPVIAALGITTICAGDSTQLTASGGALYAWSPAASLSDATIANPNAGPQATTDYKVIVTAANGCIDSARILVTVRAKPVVTISANSTVCRGDSVQLTSAGGSTYAWTPVSSLNNPNASTPKAGPLNTTTYQVVVTNAAGCKDSSQTTVTVNAKPSITLNPIARLCYGDTLQLTASGGSIYAWTPTASLENPTTPNPRAFPRDTTRYSVVVTSAEGCIDSAFTQVNVFRLPLLFQRRDTVLCAGDSFTADASTLTGSSSWLWNNGSVAPAQLISQSGTYWVHTQVSGCFNPIRDTITVSRGLPPTVTLGSDRDVCVFDPPLLSFQATDFWAFTWSTGSTDSAIRVTATGAYNVTVTGPCGTASDQVLIRVIPCNDELYFPDAFTPNNDGRNDVYRATHLPGVTVASFELVIYNRWGEQVFRTTNLNAGWDGTYRGKQQDGNTFVWFARYRKRQDDAEQFRKGSFVLLR